jgi:hypothetical protein
MVTPEIPGRDQPKETVMSKRIRVLLPIAVAIAGLAAPVAQGASTKDCTTTGSPHNNWTQTYSQTPSCTSNSNVNQTDTTTYNPGGHAPSGQQ